MSQRNYIIIAFVLAVLVTVIGWSQTFAYKVWPASHTVLWFPSVVIANTYGGTAMITLSLVQFPIFATCFAFGLRRWSVARILGALAFIYALLVGIAFIIVSR